MNGFPDITKLIRPKRKCDCKPSCKTYFKVEGVDVYCKNKMIELSEILEVYALNGDKLATDNNKSKQNKTYWKDEEVKFLCDYIKEHGIYKGIYNDIARKINKDRIAVKNRVYRLSADGVLDFDRMKGMQDMSKKRHNNTPTSP